MGDRKMDICNFYVKLIGVFFSDLSDVSTSSLSILANLKTCQSKLQFDTIKPFMSGFLFSLFNLLQMLSSSAR